jgi:hypothetical protein
MGKHEKTITIVEMAREILAKSQYNPWVGTAFLFGG